MRVYPAAAFALAVAIPVILHAQNDTPVFRSGTTVVQIDAVVTDDAGNPVTGLTADDFEVVEAGSVRPITSFAAVTNEITEPVGLPAADAEEPDVADNRRPQGRTYLFALDEVKPSRALRTRHILRDFIAEHLGPNDIASVALTGRGPGDSGQDFTSNRRLLLSAIDRFSGGFPTFAGSDSCGEGSSPRQLASSLRALTEFLATMPGRKVLIYVGELGLDFYQFEAYRGGALTPADTDAHAALVAATRGNVTIYPLDPCGLNIEFGAPELERRMDLHSIAALTGGFAITNTNNFRDAFARIVRENSVHYTIGFESGRLRTDGRYVPVDVRVKRPGMRVNARPGYLAPMKSTPERRRPIADARFTPVAEALAAPVATTHLPLQVVATPYRVGDKDAGVALVVEIDVAGLPLTNKNGSLTTPLEVSYMATDARGRLRPGRRHTTTLAIAEGALARTKETGVRVLSDFRLKPGRHQLRIAAGTETIAGSVLYDLEVPDFRKEKLSLSGIFLTADDASGTPTLRQAEVLPGVLPGTPTARRRFARSDTLGVFAEVYERRSRNAPREAITTTVVLHRADGQRVVLASEEQTGVADTPVRMATRVRLADITPGSYVLEVAATSTASAASARRRIPLVVH